MQAIALIVEYNPFHNGHLHHLVEAKKLYPEATIICILNGNFLQRGEPAILNKYIRTTWALKSGADVVLELPFAYGTQRADIFATGAVRIAASYGASAIIYGLETSLPDEIDLETLLPNQKLAFFYQEAIKKYAPNIQAIAIPRKHSQYNALVPEHESIASATAIRTLLLQDEHVEDYVPDYVYRDLISYQQHYGQLATYLPYLKYTLMIKNLTDIALNQSGLLQNIYKHLEQATDFTTFFANIHHKHTSKTHIQRLLTYLLCQVEQQTLDAALQTLWTRILGLSTKGQHYIKWLKKNNASDLTVIQKINALDTANYSLQYNSLIAYSLITNTSLQALLTQENSNAIILLQEDENDIFNGTN